MKIKLLYSSSSGNSTVVETTDGTTKILIDAGVSYKKICEAYGDKLSPNAVFITHEHGDHISGAGVIGRKTDCPIYIPQKSYEAKQSVFDDCKINYIDGGDIIEIGDFEISVFSTRHDSAASVGYTIKEKTTMKKFGFLTDTGGITKKMKDSLFGCDAYFIESDYDEEELEKFAEYDDVLKERIRSPFGHLSNQQSLDFIQSYIDLDKVSWIAMGHLSKNTNSPETLETRMRYKLPKKHWGKINIINQPTELII